MDMEKENLDGTGWFTTDPADAARFSSGQWQTADYQAGDIIVFTMKTIHMSTTNTTDKVSFQRFLLFVVYLHSAKTY